MRLGPVEIKRPERVAAGNGMRELSEVLIGREIIDVYPDSGVIVTAERSNSDASPTQYRHPLIEEGTLSRPKVMEIGAAGVRWRRELGMDEYNPELRGKTGLLAYDRMRRSDATVSQLLKIVKTPVLEAEWWVDPVDPQDKEEAMIAEFVDHCLFDWMSIGWTQLMTEILTNQDFGYSLFEKVYTFYRWKSRDRVILRKLAPRAVLDVTQWNYDKNGGPNSVEMVDFEGGRPLVIPIEQLLVFPYRREGGNMEGRSGLREAYKHWYYKENLYKIDAIQKERHGIGIPIIKLPPGFKPSDRALADELGRNLRTNEWAHVTLPPLWELEFADIRGNAVNVIESIEHHDRKILDSGIAGFAIKADNKSDAEIVMQLFMKSSRYIADLIREVFNKFLLPELVSFNWPNKSEFPELRVRHIGEVTDLRTMSFTIRNLIGAGAILPDDPLEDYLRDINDLPRRDPSTEREILQPQLPGGSSDSDPEEDQVQGISNGTSRPPRQSQARNQRRMPGGAAGEDDSGG